MKRFLSLLLSFALLLSVALPAAAYGPNDSAMDQALTARDMASAIGGKLITGWNLLGAPCSNNPDGSAICYVDLNQQGTIGIMANTSNFPATYHTSPVDWQNDAPGSPWVVPANTGAFLWTTPGYTWGQLLYGGWQSNQNVIYLYANATDGGFDLKAITVVATTPPPGDCTFNGAIVYNGKSVTAYASSSVACPSSCVPEQRTCTNGVLSGSYQYSSCATVGCLACNYTYPSNGSFPSSWMGTAWSAYNNCSGLQNVECYNGQWYGFSHWGGEPATTAYATKCDCHTNQNRSCAYTDGGSVSNGWSGYAYTYAQHSCSSQKTHLYCWDGDFVLSDAPTLNYTCSGYAVYQNCF